MKKEIILKSILVLVLTGILVLVFCAAANLRAEQILNLQTTCIAARDIPAEREAVEDETGDP